MQEGEGITKTGRKQVSLEKGTSESIPSLLCSIYNVIDKITNQDGEATRCHRCIQVMMAVDLPI